MSDNVSSPSRYCINLASSPVAAELDFKYVFQAGNQQRNCCQDEARNLRTRHQSSGLTLRDFRLSIISLRGTVAIVFNALKARQRLVQQMRGMTPRNVLIEGKTAMGDTSNRGCQSPQFNMTTFISHQHRTCWKSFSSLIATLQRPSNRRGSDEDPQLERFCNEFDRYKVWADNVGAGQYGTAYKRSLDYRLREAPYYKDQVSTHYLGTTRESILWRAQRPLVS